MLECNMTVKYVPQLKKSRLKFPSSSHESISIFQLINVDIWGPHRISTYDKKHYFITIADDYNKFTWVCLLQSKYEMIVVLNDFFSMVQNQFGLTVKILRYDNGQSYKFYL